MGEEDWSTHAFSVTDLAWVGGGGRFTRMKEGSALIVLYSLIMFLAALPWQLASIVRFLLSCKRWWKVEEQYPNKLSSIDRHMILLAPVE